MDIRACRMLREFHLDCMKFPNGLDHENFCSDFPRLETLLMGPCEAKKTVKILSSSLRTLFLFFTRMHEDSRTRVVFAPNLSTYECVGTTFKPFLNPSDAPSLLETKIGLAYHVKKIHKPLTFINLRDRLKDFSNNIGLSLCIRDDDDDDNNDERLVQHQPTQYPTSEEISIGKIKFKEGLIYGSD
ncbi:hypothetical protein MTR67_015618 [Solanum verrucosum]|uniref:Uncharacterized protein n=1 Tax=Solanum verrucosum TaxID=315347 RepID=A0AAF0QGR6_SOLVR|nr:hypothetical protein MTR67_015618 [Solanum verrucosum]